jgi:hypothetical protein
MKRFKNMHRFEMLVIFVLAVIDLQRALRDLFVT